MIKIDQLPITEGEYFDHVWETEFETRPWKYDISRHTALTSKLRPGMSLVDLAAGVYGTAQFVSEVLCMPDVSLSALDRSSLAKDLVFRMCPAIAYSLGVLPRTIFRDAEFDYVVATQIIEHQVDPELLIREMARICKPEGWLATAVIDKNSLAAVQHGPWPGQQWWMDGLDLMRMLEPFGKTEFQEVGHYHVVLCQRNNQ